jgi:tetratricopeptide (TPR) repeat protein
MGMQSDSYSEPSPSTVVLTFGQLWQVPTFFLGLVLLGTVWTTRPYWYDPESLHFQHELSVSRRAIESGAPVQEVTHLLADALAHIDRHPQQKGEVLFLLGSAYFRLAEKALGDSAKDLWRQSRNYFDQALVADLPDNDATEFVYRYAVARYYTDSSQDALNKVIEDLNVCVDKLPEERWVALGVLTQAYLNSNPPNIKAALSANERQLQLPLEDELLLDPVRLLRGELLLKTGEREEARRTLARISDQAAASLLQRARYLRAQSFQDDHLWREASPLWEEIIADKRLPPKDVGHVLYCLGLCYQNLHDAKAQQIWEKAAVQGGEEALAAELYLAELHVRAHRFDQGLKIYEKALSGVEKPEDYKVKLVPVEEIAKTLDLACQEAQKAGELDAACGLARVFSRVVKHERGALMVARTVEAKANATNDPKDFKAAGMAYEGAAAALGPGPQEVQLLWSSVKNLLAAKDFVFAESVIEHYIFLQTSPDGLSEAYFRLAEIAQAQEDQNGVFPTSSDLDKPSRAEQLWEKCYNAPGTYSGRAGVKLAVALRRRNKFAEAEKILEKLDALNLPDSHEEAIFALANTYYQHGLYSKASQAWKRALLVYPTGPTVQRERFQLGECYRQLAQSSLLTKGPELARMIINRSDKLDEAAVEFDLVVHNIQGRRADGVHLTDFENNLLLKSLFALAECKFDRSHFDDARAVYERLAVDYQEQVEGLEALKQICLSYQASFPPDPAKGLETLARMEQRLNALPDSVFQGGFDRQSRGAFESWIKKMSAEFEKMRLMVEPKNDKPPRPSNNL